MPGVEGLRMKEAPFRAASGWLQRLPKVSYITFQSGPLGPLFVLTRVRLGSDSEGPAPAPTSQLSEVQRNKFRQLSGLPLAADNYRWAADLPSRAMSGRSAIVLNHSRSGHFEAP